MDLIDELKLAADIAESEGGPTEGVLYIRAIGEIRRLRTEIDTRLATDFGAEVARLTREAHTWSKACEAATTKLHKLRTLHPRLEVRYWTGEFWEMLYGTRFDAVIDSLDPTPVRDDLMTEAADEITRLRAEVEAKQARIDALMLEHCPDEMTQEQTDNWKAHQRPREG